MTEKTFMNEAITYRLKDLGIIGVALFTRLFDEFVRRGWRVAEVPIVFRDRRFGRTYLHVASHAEMGRPDPPAWHEPFWRLINAGILDMEPPDHTRVRRLVSKAFTPTMTRRCCSISVSRPARTSWSMEERLAAVAAQTWRRRSAGSAARLIPAVPIPAAASTGGHPRSGHATAHATRPRQA